MTTPTIPPALLKAAGIAARAYAGYEGNGGEIDDYDYYYRLAKAALEAANIAKLQAAADALPGLVVALESLLAEHETYHIAAQADVIGAATARVLFEKDAVVIEARQALAAAKGGAQ